MKNEELEYDSYVDIKVHKSLEKFHFAQVPLEHQLCGMQAENLFWEVTEFFCFFISLLIL